MTLPIRPAVKTPDPSTPIEMPPVEKNTLNFALAILTFKKNEAEYFVLNKFTKKLLLEFVSNWSALKKEGPITPQTATALNKAARCFQSIFPNNKGLQGIINKTSNNYVLTISALLGKRESSHSPDELSKHESAVKFLAASLKTKLSDAEKGDLFALYTALKAVETKFRLPKEQRVKMEYLRQLNRSE